MALKWVKSSFSSGTGGNCVELALRPATVLVRDSKNPGGPVLKFSTGQWRAFTHHLKAGN